MTNRDKDNSIGSFMARVANFLKDEGYTIVKQEVLSLKDNEQISFPILAVRSQKYKGMAAVLSTDFGSSEWNDFAQKVLNDENKLITKKRIGLLGVIMRLVLTRVEAKILYAYLKGKRISSVREYIVLQDIVSRLEEVTENEL